MSRTLSDRDDSFDVDRGMGERDEETSDVRGCPGDHGEDFCPGPSFKDTYILLVHMR